MRRPSSSRGSSAFWIYLLLGAWLFVSIGSCQIALPSEALPSDGSTDTEPSDAEPSGTEPSDTPDRPSLERPEPSLEAHLPLEQAEPSHPDTRRESLLPEPITDLPWRETELLDHLSWSAIPRPHDPFASLFPQAAAVEDCTDFGISTLDRILEIDTAICPYITVQHPLLHAVPQGGLLRLYFYHVQLEAEPPAHATILVSALGKTLFQTSLPIPAPPSIYEPLFTSPVALPKGTPLLLHLHNHGSNHYLFLSLSLLHP